MARPKSKNRSPAPRGAGDSPPAPHAHRLRAAEVRNRARLPSVLAVALALVTLGLFAPALRLGFIDFDDPVYVTQNPHVRAGLSWSTWSWAWTSLEEANWHPLAWVSHLVDASLHGTDPDSAWGHHLTSITLHALNAGLALVVLAAYTRRLWPAALAAALYAWHPLRVESVVWISERKDVLSALFFWLTLAAYLAYTRRPASWLRWLLVVATFALGLAAKPMLVTLPFVLLLLDYWPLGRAATAPVDTGRTDTGPAEIRPISSDSASAESDLRGVDWRAMGPLVREKLPLFALVLASCVLTYFAQDQAGAVTKVESLPRELRVKNAVVAYVAYLGKAFWPQKLAILYPYPVQGIPWSQVLGSLLVLTLLSVVAVGLIQSRRWKFGWFPTGWFWYLGMLVPVIGLVQVGNQSMADRYTYLPLVGIALIVSFGLAELSNRWSWLAWPVRIAAVGMLVGCLFATRAQLQHWRDRVTLYRHAIAVTRDNFTAHSNLGHALSEQALAAQDRAGLLEAAAEFERALAINDTIAPSHDGLAAVYSALGEYAKARDAHRRAVELAPRDAKPANNFAWFLATCPVAELRAPAEAVALAERACQQSGQLDPSQIDTLAAAYAAAGRFGDAVAAADRAAELARQQRQDVMLQGIMARRELFQAGQSYVDPISPLAVAPAPSPTTQ